MPKLYTIQFTADELAMIEPLVAHEADYYEQSDDDMDRAQFEVCDSIIKKIVNAS
jgi:hypothetical protein